MSISHNHVDQSVEAHCADTHAVRLSSSRELPLFVAGDSARSPPNINQTRPKLR